MEDKSNLKKASDELDEEEKKEQALKDLIAQAELEKGNGKSKFDTLEEPVFLTLNLRFILDRVKIKNFDKDKIVLYIIDSFLKNAEGLLPVAVQLKKEVTSKPRLIVPSGKLLH
jgi:ribosomal protein L9